MNKHKADINADIKAITNGDEPVALLEPLLINPTSRWRSGLDDLAMDLAARAAGFRRSLPAGIVRSLATLVRAMNCYYSNLIEGHDTHPIEIERALKKDFSANLRQRNLQLEARAHIEVQAWIDGGGLDERATSPEGIKEIHRRFGELLPEELLWAEDPDTGERVRVRPGCFREKNVRVGRHIPVSPGAVPRFMERFAQGNSGLGKLERIIAVAAAHHRLLWIHPFTDGNGRVARLMSHAILRESLDTGGVWSIARGLARNVGTYKKLLDDCDQPRRNDLDGRGNLSEEALAEFSRFFLQSCLDQVEFMEGLVQPDRLRHRLITWAKEEVAVGALPSKSELVLEAVLYRGELPRSEVPNLLGVGERQARRLVSALLGQKVLNASSPRAPLCLAFPARLAPRWMPGLFPEK